MGSSGEPGERVFVYVGPEATGNSANHLRGHTWACGCVCGPVIGEQGGHLCVSSKFPGGWFFAASRCQEQREGKFLKEGPGSGELDIVNTQDSVTLVICPSRQGPVLEELKMRLTPMQKEYKPSIAFSSSVRESVRGRS